MESREDGRNYKSFYEIYKEIEPSENCDKEIKNTKEYLYFVLNSKIKNFLLFLKKIKINFEGNINKIEPLRTGLAANMLYKDLKNINDCIQEIERKHAEITIFVSKIEKYLMNNTFENTFENVQCKSDYIYVQYNKLKTLVDELNLPWLKQNLIYSKQNFSEKVNLLSNDRVSGLEFLASGYYPFSRRLLEIDQKIIAIKLCLLDLAKEASS